MKQAKPFTFGFTQELLQEVPAYYAAVADEAEAASVRRDMVTLLTYVRDNKVVGTQQTGNMPLKNIRELVACFTVPPQLESRIGDWVHKVRSEDEVWPLFFLHVTAMVGGLLKTPRGRLWTITAEGKRFLVADAATQAAFLLVTWWYRVNWLLACPCGLGDSLPPLFVHVATASLHGLPIGIAVSFADYADELIRESGLRWTAPDMTYARTSLHHSIRRMVVNVLVDFGALECEYAKEMEDKSEYMQLSTIRLTRWGKALLDAVIVSYLKATEPRQTQS